MKFIFGLVFAALIHTSHPAGAATDRLDHLGSRLCEIFAASPGDRLVETAVEGATALLGESLTIKDEPLEFRGRAIGTTLLIDTPLPDSLSLSVQLITPPMRAPRTVITQFQTTARTTPAVRLMYTQDCTLQQGWQQFFDADNKALYSQQLSTSDFLPTGPRQWLNPPPPELTPIQPPRLRVAMIDSGVNYQLPEIANALARDRSGKLIGYDFWDMDPLPFDAHPVQSPFNIQRHGTRTASIVIDEAPGIAIVPYRYPRPDMSRMEALIEHAVQHNVRIIGMPLGGNRFQEWAAFQRTAERHPQILFIASAGNNGRNIDRTGVYPASLEIDNMLVVTSANDFAEPADRTNYGPLSVDYLLPAEQISALDYDGSRREVSGSSYAVSRLVALAARLLNQSPQLDTEALKNAIEQRSIRANSAKYVSTGYLGNLFTTTPTVLTRKTNNGQDNPSPSQYQLSVDVFVLNDKWQSSAIQTALTQANKILSQCNITLTANEWYEVEAPESLQNLSTANALTLRQQLPSHSLAVYFAKDTQMQPAFDAEAFGAGNTRNRPWMRNTLWITTATPDLGIAIAHELFHIVTNNGRHTTDANNLMNDRTDKNNIELTQKQCEDVYSYAIEAQLLR